MYESLIQDEKLDPMIKKIKIIALLTGTTEDHFKDWSLEEVVMFYNSFEFLNEVPEGDIQPYYTIRGKEYKLTDSLKRLRGDQFIDLNSLIKDPKMITDQLHMICAVLLIL